MKYILAFAFWATGVFILTINSDNPMGTFVGLCLFTTGLIERLSKD